MALHLRRMNRQRDKMTIDQLPEEFKDRIQKMLRDESEAFFMSYERPSYKSLRLNPLRFDEGAEPDAGILLPDITGISETLHLSERVAWEPLGFYYNEDVVLPGKHPYHEASVYYIQEASAMAPVTYLDIRKGERILDLCAAPGGKSAQIAGYLKGSGLLVTNEIHPARVKILSENIERMGVPNAIVTNETPGRLANHFPGYFDKILVDAPCSGEGMFRKNPEAIDEWSPENVALCAARQEEILESADEMLRVGGRLVYSTCTFAQEEDEGSITRFLAKHPEYKLLPVECKGGMVNGSLMHTIRLWPHKVKGEGHFLAVLVKGEEHPVQDHELSGSRSSIPPGGLLNSLSEKEIAAFLEFQTQHLHTDYGMENTTFLRFGDNLYALPLRSPSLKGLKVVRPGLHLGTFMKNRFEPAHALAHVLRMTDTVNYVNLPADSVEVRDYLNGQMLRIPADSGIDVWIENPASPWTLLCVDGFPLGWSKNVNGSFKNHYPKGLRRAL